MRQFHLAFGIAVIVVFVLTGHTWICITRT